MSNTANVTPALTVSFCKEKLVSGSPDELALGRTDLYLPGEGKNYGPYTVIKHIAKGNGKVTAVIMRTAAQAKETAVTPAKVTADVSSELSQFRTEIDAKFSRMEDLFAKAIALQHGANNTAQTSSKSRGTKVKTNAVS